MSGIHGDQAVVRIPNLKVLGAWAHAVGLPRPWLVARGIRAVAADLRPVLDIICVRAGTAGRLPRLAFAREQREENAEIFRHMLSNHAVYSKYLIIVADRELRSEQIPRGGENRTGLRLDCVTARARLLREPSCRT